VHAAWYLWLVVAALLGPAEARTRQLYAGAGSAGALVGAAVAAAGLHFWPQVFCFAIATALGLAARPALMGFLSAGKCTVEYATPGKVTVELDKTTAWTFGAGVSVASKIGINLSAETGYTATASEGYWFTDTAHTRYLCGKNNYPLSSNPGPGYVVAGASPSGGS
jgi:hypothetical protein